MYPLEGESLFNGTNIIFLTCLDFVIVQLLTRDIFYKYQLKTTIGIVRPFPFKSDAKP